MKKLMTIHKEYKLEVAIEVLYEAWISPEMAIAPVTKIECNPVVGGIFKLFAESDEAVGIMIGVFEEVTPSEKLKYSWQWEGSEEKSVVKVQFIEEKGHTLVQLEHSGFVTQESKDAHDAGWDSYINGLIRNITN